MKTDDSMDEKKDFPKISKNPFAIYRNSAIFPCQQLRMGIRLFPCCLIALLTCKNSAPLCPTGDGKIPRFDPFKGNFGACIKSTISALKSQNGNNL